MKCGCTVAEFWALTPRETRALIEAWQWNVERERKRDLWVAWHTAALSRTKRLQPLKWLLQTGESRVLEGEELAARRRERDEMLARIDVEKLATQRRRDAETGSKK